MDGNYRTSLFPVIKASVRIFLSISIMLLSAGTASAQTLLHKGIYHETGVVFDGSWQTQSGPLPAVNVYIYDTSMEWGGERAVRRGNANVYGFQGMRYNIIRKDNGNEATGYYYVVNESYDIIRVLELNLFGNVSLAAFMTAKGEPSVNQNVNGSYNNSNSNTNTTKTKSDSDRYGYKTCHLCNGSGNCHTCLGDGFYYGYNGSRLSCPNCYVNERGKCSECKGTGKVYGLKGVQFFNPY